MLNSSPDPSFFHPAGARLTVIFLGGKEKPVFLSAARMRSRLSRTVASGRPTMENCGSPAANIDFDFNQVGPLSQGVRH